MPSGLAGYNIRLDGVKVNDAPVTEAQPFTLSGLVSATDYSSRITIAPIDNAGNESTPVSVQDIEGPASAVTADPTPTGGVLPQEKRDAIDVFAANTLKPTTKADGVIIGITTPGGDYYMAYGGDRTANSPLTLDDKMRYGSITKMYTALLVLAQIDAGHLSLDDTLDQFASVTGAVPNSDRITIKHLLMMQSGIKDYLQQDAEVSQSYFLNPTATFDPMPKIRSYPPLFEPGSRSSYSNSNYILLGKILEWADAEYGTGRDVRTIILEDCCAALGLTETEWPTGNYMTVPYSRGWSINFAYDTLQQYGPLAFLAPLFMPGVKTTEEVEWTAVSTTWGGAAGALDGTIADLVKFGEAVAAGSLLSPGMRQLRDETFVTYTTYTPAHPWEGPGWMGFGLGVIQWGHWLGWVGNLGGYLAVMFVNPNTGSVVAVMINHMQGPAIDLAYRICYLLDPESTELAAWKVRPTTAPSSSSVGAPGVYVYHDPGDEDSKTDVALKIPFYI